MNVSDFTLVRTYTHAGAGDQSNKQTNMLRSFIIFSLFLHSCVAAPQTPTAAAAVPAKKWLTLNGMYPLPYTTRHSRLVIKRKCW